MNFPLCFSEFEIHSKKMGWIKPQEDICTKYYSVYFHTVTGVLLECTVIFLGSVFLCILAEEQGGRQSGET